MDEDVLDVIVVGAGLAGLACAHRCAAAGLQTAVLERGDGPGTKCLSGGRLYLEPVRTLCADMLEGAPLERPVDSETIVLCDQQASASFRLDTAPGDGPAGSHTVLRSSLDQHLASRVEALGAMILPQQRAEALVRDGERVCGVRVGPEEIKSRVVVAADGALSFLAEEAGLRPARKPGAYAVGVKEVIELDAARIEERFNLAEGRGAARLYLGEVTRGLPGGGFLYTNRESLSIGLVFRLDGAGGFSGQEQLADLLEEFKQRDDVAPLLAGGRTVEYGAHLVPEGGFGALPQVGVPGLLLAGDAAGFVINTGAVLRGMDLALASGTLAGQSIVAAHEAKAGPEDALRRYRETLQESFVMRQLRAHRKAPRVLEQERLYRRYPQELVRWAAELLRVDASGAHPRMKQAVRKLRKQVLGWRGLRDAWRISRM